MREQSLDLETVYFDSFTRTLQAVDGETLGIVPIENLIDGFIGPTLDFLEHHEVYIRDEVLLPVEHALASVSGKREDIAKIYVQFSTREQCRIFLESFEGVEIVTTASNALSAHHAQSEPQSAAVIPHHAGEFFGLQVLEGNVSDYPQNQTRFIVVTAEKPTAAMVKGVVYKTSLLLYQVAKDKPGSLRDMLASFADRSVNLRSIMSKPTRESFGAYHFFIDVEGNFFEQRLQDALHEIGQDAQIKLLGTYPVCDGRLF
jgi:prephenate dehydratase